MDVRLTFLDIPFHYRIAAFSLAFALPVQIRIVFGCPCGFVPIMPEGIDRPGLLVASVKRAHAFFRSRSFAGRSRYLCPCAPVVSIVVYGNVRHCLRLRCESFILEFGCVRRLALRGASGLFGDRGARRNRLSLFRIAHETAVFGSDSAVIGAPFIGWLLPRMIAANDRHGYVHTVHRIDIGVRWCVLRWERLCSESRGRHGSNFP